MASPALARIIAGCYEEMIVCYDVIRTEEEKEEEGREASIDGDTRDDSVNGLSKDSKTSSRLRLKLSFTDHPHSGSVRCIAASKGGIIASGSNDETIHVYNANTGRDVGALISHGGSVTSLQFHGAKYLVSGSEDNNVIIWRTKPKWDVLKTLRGHKGPVESVAVHPSGKIALSTGKDRTLKTWNLIKGRSAYVTNVKQEGSLVRWSPSGKYYALVVGASGLRVYDVATAAVVFSFDHKHRINALRFLGSGGGEDDDLLIFGGEGKEMDLASIKAGKIIASFDVHETRLRDLIVVDVPEDYHDGSGKKWIATGSNDGWIKLWNLNPTAESPSCHLLGEANAGVRVTCLCSFTKRSLPSERKGKTKTGVEEEEEEVMEEGRKGDVEMKRKSDTNDDAKKNERTLGKKVKFA